MYLERDKFLNIINSTPLVSIDLVIENEKGEILLGKRSNRPAQNYWFVVGGIIRKNQKIKSAFNQIIEKELGIQYDFNKAILVGCFDHIYEDNYWGEPYVNTHYVSLGFRCKMTQIKFQINDQHEELRWWSVDELLNSKKVHPNIKNYFNIDG